MQSQNISLLYTTVATAEEAEKLAQSVLQEKLAMCVNIFPQGRSIYLWEGKIEDSSECYLLFKTMNENVEHLLRFIKKHHSYENPALLHWEAGASKEFFEYINNL